MTARDGRIIAAENEMRVLRALHRFGWLRTRDIGALIWHTWARSPSSGPTLNSQEATEAGLRMAQRTLRRLFNARQVLRSKAPDSSVIYSLSEGGARRLQSIGVAAQTGKDMMRAFSAAHFRHRTTANEIAIGGIIEGFRVATEREIAQDKWLGGATGIAGKKPDVLLRHDNQIWWVEVERSRKNASDYAKLLKWIQTVAVDSTSPTGATLLGEELTWAKIVFVCTPAFQVKLTRDLETAGLKKSFQNTLLSFSTTLYKFEDILFA